MNVVIFGCGRTGAALALQLAIQHKVVVIEQNPEALQRLGYHHNCKVVMGRGVDDEILQRADIQNADAFFAVTRGDNSNIMAAQIVRLKYNVPHICIRVSDPNRANAYRQLGYFCINPSNIIAGMMHDWLLEIPYKPIDAYNQEPKEMEV